MRLIPFKRHTDSRGSLVAVEGERDVPFPIRRRWHIKGVPEGATRGGHAHREAQQVVIALVGSFRADVVKVAPTEGESASVLLDDDGIGLHVEPGEWLLLSRFSSDAVCEVLSDRHYDQEDFCETDDT